MEKNIIQRKIVSGAIIKDGKILIIQRSADETLYPNLWELPGGKRDPLEHTNDALRREIKEEAGLDVEIIKILSVFDYQMEKENEIRDATQINFLVEPIGDVEVKLSPDHQNYAWISAGEIDNYNITKETKGVIRDAFENL